MNNYIEKYTNKESKTFQYDLFHFLLTEGADFVGRYKFAQLTRTNYVPTTEDVIPFNALMSYVLYMFANAYQPLIMNNLIKDNYNVIQCHFSLMLLQVYDS